MTRRTVLITGASRGIGRSIALRLAADGFDIAIHYHARRADAEQTALDVRQLGREARLLQFDVTARGAARDALDEDLAAHGPPYGVVANAGIAADGAFPAMTGQDWDSVIDTSLDGFYNVLNPLVLPMIAARRGGRIVTISSVSGIAGNRGQVNYSAAKAGLIGATKALALELAKRKITVNCVAPGLIATDMIEGIDTTELLKMIPARRLGRPEEVAAAVSYLFSDDAEYVTRQVLSVNGGLI